MTDIDWSKAPEGATHWEPNSRSVLASWMKLSDDGRWYYWTLSVENQTWAATHVGPGRAETMIPRPAQPWSGDGLPPAGTVCEVFNNDLNNAEWEQCTILFSGKHRIVYDSESCSERVGDRDCLQFRPIKTPAQLAADEREAAIEAMWAIYWQPSATSAKKALGLLWDAGLRLPKGDAD